MPPRPNPIPKELRERPQWITWSLVDGRKIPNGKVNDPSTWTSYEAVESAERKGFVFSPDDQYCGIDLDECTGDDGEIVEWAKPILERFRGIAYAEISPSGKGIKLFVRAKKPDGTRCTAKMGDGKQQIECYDHDRYFAVTGNVVAGCTSIGDGQAAVDWLFKTYLKGDSRKTGSKHNATLKKASAALLKRGQNYVDNIQPASNGERNNAAFRIAGHLHALIDSHGDRLSDDDVFDLMGPWNDRSMDPLPEAELLAAAINGRTNGTPPADKPPKNYFPRTNLSEKTMPPRDKNASRVNREGRVGRDVLEGIGSSRDSREGRAGRVVLRGIGGKAGKGKADSPLASIESFLTDYVVLSSVETLVVALWILASWMTEIWDRFPHLAVTSPEKRCGKTLLLHLIELLVRVPYNTSNISPAAVYRLIALHNPTLIFDEAQSVVRRGSESSELIRELLNAGIDKTSKVLRVGGANRDEIEEFSNYCPKVLGLIGYLDSVLADRCLSVKMKRKTKDNTVERYRSRVVTPIGEKLKSEIEKWVNANSDQIADVFDSLDTFDMENDRLAELLLPLQSILTVAAKNRLPELEAYAHSLDETDVATETPGIQLLRACREIFAKAKPTERDFLPTTTLILKLVSRSEEPWQRWSRGASITPEGLANLLRPYNIKSDRGDHNGPRGFFRSAFKEAWGRYLPAIPLRNPALSADPALTDRSSPTDRGLERLAKRLRKRS